MRSFYRNLTIWLLIALAMIFLFNFVNTPRHKGTEISYTDFINMVEKGQISEVTIEGKEIRGILGDKHELFYTYIPDGDTEIIPLLRKAGVRINVKPHEENPWYLSLLVSWLPMLLLIGVWIFFMRQMQAGSGRAFSFGRSRAKMVSGEQVKVTFKDVAGVDEAKEELQEVIEFLKDPQKFTKLGGRIPKGILLVGPPGTGKTLLAKAIAGEAGVPFFSISGSDFVEMFVGVGAARVRDLFNQAKKNAPCIIFIDEIDAVGRHRGAGLGGGHDEREQTLNQLLVEMDGFEGNEGIIVIAATNRPDILDPALLRPGRFDRQVVVPPPDVKGREKILEVHTKKVPLAPDVDLAVLAKATPGFTGADLENLVNEAALIAARKGKTQVEMEDFEEAKDKILMGRERKTAVISEEEKRITAYHEAGHTMVAKLLPGTDPVHKVSIIPRGQALGITQQLPLDERHTYPKDYLLKRLMVLLGGRAAEELVFNEYTTGAGNDIERATEIARRMVCEWGMSEKLGPVAFGHRQEHVFLGKEISQIKNYSEATALAIDNEIREIVLTCYQKAKKLLEDNIELLHKLAQALLEKETLDGPAIDEILGLAHKSSAEGAVS
ncbi:MAG TPA: ATP-dependent metallopeptidase FtsH/Yme1/Tma family protein [Thermodesulfatator atlanticus]|uniref:ATP-dependent zinc metalloprotease FtsH n=1 Tax=Thermodesulfatator atlanticus TaxID=501497 RepID=A0A7V5P122_9BACT|nr:ATP-dependent metallopeptidase FtsH/Yme1/Tma family protein [Thermodesulfatator atlanticus]